MYSLTTMKRLPSRRDANFSGVASFDYFVNDGNGGTDRATVQISVGGNNDAPTTSPVTLTPIVEDSGIRVITQAELLANASDVEGDPLMATNLEIASGNGTLDDNGDGTWNYTPAADDDSDVSFTYTITDGALSAAGNASLDITPSTMLLRSTWMLMTARVQPAPTLTQRSRRAGKQSRLLMGLCWVTWTE